MFKTKNLTPNQLSLFTALILSIPEGIVFFFVSSHPVIALIAVTVTFFGSYLLISFVLRWFIYRKIKLIYKFIYQTKATKKEETYYKYVLPQKSIDEVQEDVTKWAQQRKEEIEMLKTNEAFRKEFLQNLSHELKTPIFAIQGYVETLLHGAMEDPELNKKFLENTGRNVERMVNLVNDLDEISKLESGEQRINKTRFIVQDVIKEVFQSLYILSEAKKIKATIKKGCETPLFVYAD